MKKTVFLPTVFNIFFMYSVIADELKDAQYRKKTDQTMELTAGSIGALAIGGGRTTGGLTSVKKSITKKMRKEEPSVVGEKSTKKKTEKRVVP